jgi:hypothetical protein
MPLLLNPLLEGLEAARNAVPDAIHPDDEVTVDDQGDRWVFEFTPRDDVLGGGARVSIAKNGLRVLAAVRTQ